MPISDSYQRCSFGGIDIAYRRVRARCVARHHEHIYLKTPGAATEKQGRGLYRFEVDAVFDVNLPGFPNNYPNGLSALRRLFEQQATASFVHPSIGAVPCWMPEWAQDLDVRIKSGESCPLIFAEDNTVAFLENALRKVNSTTANSTHEAFQLAVANVTPRPNIFDQIQDAANDIFALFDQAVLGQSLVAAKIEGLAGILRAADRDLQVLKDPTNFELVYALQDLLAATLQLGRDLTFQQGEPRIYTVPMTMSVAQISVAIYGDTNHFSDIVSNNRIDDPLSVPAGTQIIYFPGGFLNAA